MLKLEDNILKQLFLQRFPKNAQLFLASTSEAVTIKQFTEINDKIVEVAAPTPSIAAATHQPLGATSEHSVIQDLQSTQPAHGTSSCGHLLPAGRVQFFLRVVSKQTVWQETEQESSSSWA